jgi:hypothetical protein
MSDFGKFFDDERARIEKKAEDKAQAEAEKRQATKEDKVALQKPMRDVVDPIIAAARKQLGDRNLEIELLGEDALGGSIAYSFRLQGRPGHRLRGSPSIYGFEVKKDGSIAGFKTESSKASAFRTQLFSAKPGMLTAAMVEDVIKDAIRQAATML